MRTNQPTNPITHPTPASRTICVWRGWMLSWWLRGHYLTAPINRSMAARGIECTIQNNFIPGSRDIEKICEYKPLSHELPEPEAKQMVETYHDSQGRARVKGGRDLKNSQSYPPLFLCYIGRFWMVGQNWPIWWLNDFPVQCGWPSKFISHSSIMFHDVGTPSLLDILGMLRGGPKLEKICSWQLLMAFPG